MTKNINIHEFLRKFAKEYNFLYENDPVAGQQEATKAFDEFMKSESNARFVREFVAFRGDVISSDREAAAFMFALSEFE